MTLELKGLFAAIAAGLFVLGAAFGISAVVRGHGSGAAGPLRPAVAQSADQKSDGAVTESQIARGHLLFSKSCSSCHGAQGEGAFGPALRGISKSDAQIASAITRGVKGRMPAFAGKYGRPDVQALVAYVRSLKN